MDMTTTDLYSGGTAESVICYSEKLSLDLPQYITNYHTHVTRTQPDSIMMISTSQAQSLVFLARLMGAKRGKPPSCPARPRRRALLATDTQEHTHTVLDIGTYLGFSTMAFSHAVGPGGKVTGIELNLSYLDLAKEALAAHNIANARFCLGSAVSILPRLPTTEPQDLVFIHTADESEYGAYLQTIVDRSPPGRQERLLRAGGLVMVNSVLHCGDVADLYLADPEDEVVALRQFNEVIRGCGRLEVWMVPLWDGVLLARLID
jgi:predicted O-methyltransferase YrrM